MDREAQDKVMAFDALFTTNHIQILKVFMTYLEPRIQKNIAFYIKLMELQYTLSFFRMYPDASMTDLHQEETFSPEKLLNEILPYCTPSEQENLTNIKNTLQSFTNMQEMMQMLQSIKELFPEGESPFSGEGLFSGDASDILSHLTGAGGNDGGMDFSQILNLMQAMKE